MFGLTILMKNYQSKETIVSYTYNEVPFQSVHSRRVGISNILSFVKNVKETRQSTRYAENPRDMAVFRG